MSNEDSEKSKNDLNNLLNSAINDFNNPDKILDIQPQQEFSKKPEKKNEDFEELFKKLMNDNDLDSFEDHFKSILQKVDSNGMSNNALMEEMDQIWSNVGANSNINPEMSSFFNDVLKNILAKNVLYPSLKELSKKYPDWLKEKKETIPKEDYERYSMQYELIEKVCAIYEKCVGDKLGDKEFKELVEYMQKMQKCGNPPNDIIDESNSIGKNSMKEMNQLFSEIKNQNQCNQM